MRRTAAEAAATREAITRSALHRFARDGWEGCSLVEVARGAGVTRGAVYHHFSGKRDLLITSLSEQWQQWFARLVVPLQGDEPPRDRLVAFLEAYLRLLVDDEQFRDLAVVSTLVAPQAACGDPAMTAKRDGMRPWSERIEQVLAEADPALQIDAAHGRFVLTTFIHGATSTAALSPTDLPAAERCRAVAESVVGGLFPGGRAAARERPVRQENP